MNTDPPTATALTESAWRRLVSGPLDDVRAQVVQLAGDLQGRVRDLERASDRGEAQREDAARRLDRIERTLSALDDRLDVLAAPPTVSQEVAPAITRDDVAAIVAEALRIRPPVAHIEVDTPVRIARWYSDWKGIGAVSLVALALGAGLSGGMAALAEIVAVIRHAMP